MFILYIIHALPKRLPADLTKPECTCIWRLANVHFGPAHTDSATCSLLTDCTAECYEWWVAAGENRLMLYLYLVTFHSDIICISFIWKKYTLEACFNEN